MQLPFDAGFIKSALTITSSARKYDFLFSREWRLVIEGILLILVTTQVDRLKAEDRQEKAHFEAMFGARIRRFR